jgi:hypothetical protein
LLAIKARKENMNHRTKPFMIEACLIVMILCGGCGLIGIWLFRSTQSRVNALRATGDPFLLHLQHHHWQQAHTLLTPSAQKRYSPTALQQRWYLLEQSIGSVQKWSMDYFEFRAYTGGAIGRLIYRVEGTHGQGWVELQLRRIGQSWRVDLVMFRW